VNWLLDHAPVGTRWCLIHATHIDASERLRLASGGAVAGLCPTTEANLGDGIFPLHAFLTEGGRFGIGSDSNVGTSPAEELRWLDYVGRLQSRTRVAIENSYVRALAGGAQALGRNAGAIAAGKTADLVVLDTGHPALVGRSGYQLIDSWLFGGNSTPVRDVMVSGRWVVRDGRHHAQEAAADTFARTMRRLAASL
jgi:formimidoylglutamate deiminase